MTLSPGRLWAAYVAAALTLGGGVGAGVLMNPNGEAQAPDASPPPPTSIRVSIPSAPTSVYPQSRPTAAETPPSCSSVTAVDAENVSRQFVLAVGDAYAETSQSTQCQAATVVAYSEARKREYSMTCVPEAAMVRCTGGDSAVIVLRPSA